jgi:hypothetical protein
MKQLYTLFLVALVCLLSSISQAQLSQNFDTNGSYVSNCWSFAGFSLIQVGGIQFLADEYINQ